MPRVEKKEYTKKRRRYSLNVGLRSWNTSGETTKANPSIESSTKIGKDFQPRTILCRDKEGTLLSEEDDILRRWAEHFDEMLNTELYNQNVTSQETCRAYLDTDEPTPTLEEVENAIQKLKDNKAPAIDLVQAELIRKANPEFVEYMYHLITKIWSTETIPEDWNWSIICPIHKKGDVTICSNYRGISLLCVACKIFSSILFNRLTPYVETTIGDYQCGYRSERSAVDQIFTVRQIL
jgi:hypothetical protein